MGKGATLICTSQSAEGMIFLFLEYIVFSVIEHLEFEVYVQQVLICMGRGDPLICLFGCYAYLSLAVATWQRGKVLMTFCQ